MNQDTKQIMSLLKVDVETALLVQEKMDCSGIDYSECSKREFEMAARDAFAELAA
jgi:hypothetical protein